MAAFGLSILIFSVTESTKINTSQMVYFNNMNRVYRLAESGSSSALGQLSIDPTLTTITGTVAGEGEYTSYVKQVSSPSFGTFYVVTSASRTVGGKDFSCNLHTYASVVNLGEYFAAFQNEFILSPGITATNGKIYAPNVTFLISAAVPQRTEALAVEYVYTSLAKNDLVPTETWTPNQWAVSGPAGAIPITPNEIFIGSHPTTSALPRQLTTLRNLPSVTHADLTRYRNQLGGASHIVTQLSGDIFPPGYYTGSGLPDPLDMYAGHANDNRQHVYYAEGDLILGDPNSTTTVYGQVLFVATGSIILQGNIVSAAVPSFPGGGSTTNHLSSSSAHQAVFITPKDIVIAAAALAPAGGATINIQGLMYAPNGQLRVTQRVLPAVPPLNYNFVGSQIFSGAAPNPYNLPSQFQGTRTYAYMSSLKTNPPPYLPALITIFYQWEDVVSGSIY